MYLNVIIISMQQNFKFDNNQNKQWYQNMIIINTKYNLMEIIIDLQHYLIVIIIDIQNIYM